MKKKKVIIAGIVVVLLIIAGVLVYKMTHGNVTSYSPEFEEEQTQTGSAGEVGKSIKIPGYTNIYVKADTKEVSVDLENPEENGVYFEISFVLTETGETIYQSKYLAPGQHLYDIVLNRELDAGEYEMTVHYSTYAMDDEYTPRNGADVTCKLIAQ